MSAARVTILLSWWTGWRPIYDVGHVRALVAQLRRFVFQPIRIALLTDQLVTAAEVGVDMVAPMPEQGAACPEPAHRPNCYRRLKFFDPSFNSQFGTPWIVSLDLDALILRPMDDLLDHAMSAESGLSIVRSRYVARQAMQLYNGSFFAIRVGAQPQVWTDFDWVMSPVEVSHTGFIGSDQVWISMKAPGAQTIGAERGVYYYEQHVANPLEGTPAVLVTFAGILKPWSKMARRQTPQYWNAYQQFAGM